MIKIILHTIFVHYYSVKKMPRTNNKHNADGSAFQIVRKNLTQNI